MGISALKETHSIVQVSWTAQGAPELQPVSFELLLEVTYADGFVEKSRSAGDGRGMDVTLTQRGMDRLVEAYPTHLASVRRRIMDHVDRASLREFGQAIAAVVQSFENENEPRGRRS